MNAATLITPPLLSKLRDALEKQFPAEKVDEILQFHDALCRDARLEAYDDCLNNCGKFVEAFLKCLHFKRTREVLDAIKTDQEVTTIISELEKDTSLSTEVRMALPRALRTLYDLRTKRGGAHNFSFNPNRMDCQFAVATANWLMEELTRLYLTNEPEAAIALVENLLVKEIPLVQAFEDDYLVQIPDAPARLQIELLLYKMHPKRCTTAELEHWVKNQSAKNVQVSLANLKKKLSVHYSAQGWTLTDQGILETEAEVKKLSEGGDKTPKPRAKRGTSRGRQRTTSRTRRTVSN